MKKLLYKKVFEDLEEKIINNIYAINSKLPSDQELSKIYNVSTITIKRALLELKEQGYISRKPKQGTIVTSDKKQVSNTKLQSLDLPLIGCIMTNFDDTFGTHILTSILETSESKAHIIVKKSYGEEKKEEKLIQEFISMDVDGIILLPSSSKYLSPTILELASQKFPLLVIDRTLEGLPISSITTNNVESAEILTSYLFELGHKNIGLLTSSNIVSSVEERIQGYIKAHATNKVTMNNTLYKNFIQSVVPNSTTSIQDDIEKIALFINEHPFMTGIVASEYNIALLIQQACELLGKNIPEDISVVCFDHSVNYFNKNSFKFTHIEQPQYKIGCCCVNQLLHQINTPSIISKKVLEGELIIGTSTKEPFKITNK